MDIWEYHLYLLPSGRKLRRKFLMKPSSSIVPSFPQYLTAMLVAAFALGNASAAPLISQHFSGDVEAQAIADGLNTLRLPVDEYESNETWPGLRILNAYRLLGYENDGIPWGTLVDAASISALDLRVAAMEPKIHARAQLLPRFSAISGPDFKNSLRQSFAAHLYGSVLGWMNAGGNGYQKYSNECLLANVIPQMCGVLVDMGVTDGSFDCWSGPLRTNQIIQSPDFFGFNNVRTEITASQDPNSFLLPSTFSMTATVVHEFVHDLDTAFDYEESPMHRQYDRKTYCGPNLMNFGQAGDPFEYGGVPGAQSIADYVSYYASGLNNNDLAYRNTEDAAESVTAYILVPEQFRKRMANSAVLSRKYAYIRDRLFNGTEFRNPGLSATADYVVPATIGEFYTANHLPMFVITDIQTLPRGPAKRLNAKIVLQGAQIAGGSTMRTDLNRLQYLPSHSPYGGFAYAEVPNGFFAAHPDIVDWVRIELRRSISNTTVVSNRSVFVNSQGDLVDTDGSVGVMTALAPGSYSLAVFHRSHLPIMSSITITSDSSPTTIDLRSTPLIAGDVNADGVVRYNGFRNDKDAILTALGGSSTQVLTGYYNADVNLDGAVKYNGFRNDKDYLLLTVLGGVSTAVIFKDPNI